MNREIKKGMFCINEDMGIFEGYSSGKLWNGWECPVFTKEAADRICKAFSDNQTIALSYHEQSDCFVVNYSTEGMTDFFEGEDFEIDRGIKHLHPLGSHECCWSKVPEVQNLEPTEWMQIK